MINVLPESRENILVISAIGKLTDKDYFFGSQGIGSSASFIAWQASAIATGCSNPSRRTTIRREFKHHV